MKQYFFNIPLLKSKILFEISDGEYKKNREPELADYFIFVKNPSDNINTSIIQNIEDVLFHLYKKKDKQQESEENSDLKYKAYYKKYNTYIRQEHKLPLYLNNTIVIFEELYNYIIKEYEHPHSACDNYENEIDEHEYADIEEVSLSMDEPVLSPAFSGDKDNNQGKSSISKNINKPSSVEQEYDSSFLFDKEDDISVDELKDSMGIDNEEFDSDSDIPDFPIEDPDKNKSKSRFVSETVNITKDEENGEFLLSGLLDQAGFDKNKDKK